MNLRDSIACGIAGNIAWIVFMAGVALPPGAWASPARLGDLNEDGVATIRDVVILLDHIHGRHLLTPERVSFADVNRDGAVDSTDVELVAGAAVAGLLLKEIDFRPTVVEVPAFSLLDEVELKGNNFPMSRVQVSSPYGVIESVSDSRGQFSLEIPLRKNHRFDVFVTGFGADGDRLGNEPIRLIQDSVAPSLQIAYPPDESETDADVVLIAGRVQDALTGNEGLRVDVDGLAARVRLGNGIEGTFISEPIALELGGNEFTVRASDGAGNQTEKRVRVVRTERAESRLVPIRGDRQVGEVGAMLKEPLQVQVLGPGGLPLVGKLVVFELLSDLGTLLSRDESKAGKMLVEESDADGYATVRLRLSQEAGEGNHWVRARSRDVGTDVTFVASALPRTDHQLSLVTGDGQTAPVNAFAISPLRVWLHDGRNALRERAIRFEILSGQGKVNGRDRITVLSDAGGFAEVRFQFGAVGGLNQVVARASDDDGMGVVFNLFGQEAVGADSGSVVAVLVTPYFRAVSDAMATLIVEGVEFGPVKSDASGLVQLTDVPPGAAEFRVWRSEEDFGAAREPIGIRRFYRHPGSGDFFVDPVILPMALDQKGVRYDGTSDVQLSLAGLPGFSMMIKAGTVKLGEERVPSPSESVFLTLRQIPVTALPTTPPLAELPSVAWILEPAGLRLSEAAKLSLPDLESVAADASPRSFGWDASSLAFVPLPLVGSGAERGVLISQGGLGFVSTRFQTGRVAVGENPRTEPVPVQ